MGKWTKYYFNGSRYVGTDDEVFLGKASWSRSFNENIIAVELEHNGFILKIEGAGDYWQSDTFQYCMSDGRQKILKRRIQKRVDGKDGAIAFKRSHCGKTAVFYTNIEAYGNENDSKKRKEMLENLELWLPIQKRWIGKWFVFEYELRTGQTAHYFSDVKI